jgi:hypothetical protein
MKTIICEIIVRFTLETVENVLFTGTSFVKIYKKQSQYICLNTVN